MLCCPALRRLPLFFSYPFHYTLHPRYACYKLGPKLLVSANNTGLTSERNGGQVYIHIDKGKQRRTTGSPSLSFVSAPPTPVHLISTPNLDVAVTTAMDDHWMRTGWSRATDLNTRQAQPVHRYEPWRLSNFQAMLILSLLSSTRTLISCCIILHAAFSLAQAL